VARSSAALIISNVVALLSNLLSTVGVFFQLPSLFLASRVAGFAFSSINFVALTLIIMESVPAFCRGTANFVAGTTLPMGMVVGMAAGMDEVFGQRLTVLVGVCSLPVLLATVTAFFIPESPKYLLLVKKDRQAALESLVFYQGMNVDHGVLLDEIQAEEEEGESAAEGKGHLLTVIKELFGRRQLRNSMILGLVALQLTVGIYPIQTEVLLAHFDEEQAQLHSTILFAVSFAAGVVGIPAVEKMQRRTLMLASGAANVAAITAYVVLDRLTVYVADELKWGCLLSLAVYNASFGVGVGTLANYVCGELLPQRYRSMGQSLVYAINILITFVLTLTILPAYERFDVYSFIPLLILPGVYCVFHLWLYLPETNGKETHEVIEEQRRRYGSDVNAIAPPPPRVAMVWGEELGWPKV
jgi:Sugar (and other) transporter